MLAFDQLPSHGIAMRFIGLAALLVLATSFGAAAQDAVPTEILERTKLIKVGDQTGTGFLIDHNGKIYLVTARHVVAGIPTENPTLQIWHENVWENYQFPKLLFPSSPDADVAVLETNKPVPQPYLIGVMSENNGAMTLGQQVWFLGYPFADISITSHFQNDQLPFIKRATFSAVNAVDPHAVVLYFDGFNNPGFSGGPIIFWSFGKHMYEIAGVVKGYRNDTAHVLINGQQLDSNILVNSGILVGYSIKHAIEAIDNEQE